MLLKQKKRLFWIYALPTLAIFVTFVVIPFCYNIYLAMSNWDGFSKTVNYIGLKNFKELIHDKAFYNALWNNVKMLLIGTVFTMGIALFFAIVLTRSRLREREFYRILFFFPNMLSVVIVGMLWAFIFNASFGLLNAFLELVGLGDLIHVWLGELKTALPALCVPWIWSSVGYYMVLFISAIDNIPHEIYEAASLDGANLWQQSILVIIPMIKEMMRTAIVFFIINAFSNTYTLVDIMTEGGPAGATDVISYYMYQSAFEYNRFGYASAIGVFLFLIMFVLAMIFLAATKSDSLEY